jgi:hypothetical protein
MWPVGNGNRRLTHVDVPDAFSVIMAVSITQGVRLIFFSLSLGEGVRLITPSVQFSLTKKKIKRSRKITFVLLPNFKDPVSCREEPVRNEKPASASVHGPRLGIRGF